MKYLLLILSMSILLSGEMEVDGNLKVTGTIQASTIDSLLSLIAQLEIRIAQLECQNTGIIPDGYCDCFFHTLDECGVCNGDNSSCSDCANIPNGESLEDNCGTCDLDYSNDCVPDCFGEWGGTAVEDVCGECGGDAIAGDECYVTDVDGNTYEIIQIGDQTWMSENLKVAHYNDGEEINNSTENWGAATDGRYKFCDGEYFGYHYNWHAVNDERGLCMEGWHVATDAEWKELELFIGMAQQEVDNGQWRGSVAYKLKSTNDNEPYWLNYGGGTDEYGFTAYPAGIVDHSNGVCYLNDTSGEFWTSTPLSSGKAFTRIFNYEQEGIHRDDYFVNYGYSVRCIKD